MLPKHLSNYRGRTRRFERANKYIRNILLALILLCTTTVIGVIGFMFIDGYSFWEAFYMTIITLSTVGYGEVRNLSPAGQIFTSFLIIFNLGVFAYAISIISNFFIEGELNSFVKYYRMYKKIQRTENHTIVCGYGRHGHQVCDELIKNNLPFVVIEPDQQRCEELKDTNYSFIEGDATDDDILIQAGIQKARAVVVTYSENAFNVYTVLTARQLNPKLRIITRAADHVAEKKLLRAGANHVVLTEVIGGFYMATLIYKPNVVEFFNIVSNMGDVSMHFKEAGYMELQDQYRDKTIQELNLREKAGVNIIGVKKADGNYIVNPNPDIKISRNMSLVLLGDVNQIRTFKKVIMKDNPPIQEHGSHSRR